MRLIIGVALCLCAMPALAGRPFATEDAGVLDARECEPESYLVRRTEGNEPTAHGG